MRYWKRVSEAGEITTVESYSHNFDILGAIEITEEAFNNYIASLPPPNLVSTRDLASEMDDLKARVGELERR